MATYAQLQADAKSWLKRQDIDSLLLSWVRMAETDIAEMLRVREMIVRGSQPVDGAFIQMPPGFVRFESVRFQRCGELLALEDHFSGPWAGGPDCSCGCSQGGVTAYRMVGTCIEFLPHPVIPDPLPDDYTPQMLEVAWYQRPTPLTDPQDTNAVLDNYYQVYLTGVVRYGAMYGMDDDREKQMTTRFAEAVAVANRAKEDGDFSGAPLRLVSQAF